ncbi:MAG: alpha-galactosidase [Lachnospiraceae bacterium]|nr:alpha-galactosidase [Candidatus Merdinaster equi]
MKLIRIDEAPFHIVFGINEDNELKLLHFSKTEFNEEDLPEENFIKEAFQLVQVSFSGYNRPYEKHGNKHIVTAPGYTLKFLDIKDMRNETGRCLMISQIDEKIGAKVITDWQFFGSLGIIRMRNTVYNISDEVQTLEYISSFAYTGIEKEGSSSSDDKLELRIPHNGWQKEMNWKTYSFPDLGLGQTQPVVYQRTSKTIEVTNTGNWSTKEYLPMGYLANTEANTALFWQIEHNGSWHWEIGDQGRCFYLNVSGPTEIQSHWYKDLKPGEGFTSVPVAVGVSDADFAAAMDSLTKYRRIIRRPNADNENLPVIFNDYMNCLFGDPTTEKELPLVDAAAEAGCEYFVIDAGWYADGEWWANVGEWQESRKRFPNGIKEVTDYIRSKGMVPGVWLELEVMGIDCEKAKAVPDNWFFIRHGKRVFDRSRYQLDFRNPKVIEHVNEVVDRVVNEYGVGYIKMDYNIEPGIGTEIDADSVGDGLMQHEKAYLEWLDEIFAKYPNLVIENCSSGGLRIDYALLSRYSIQSTSDQEDYINYATISVNAPTGVTPEQAAVWSYPQREGMKEKEGSLRAQADLREETIYNTVNAMLLRIHQSGHLAELSKDRFDLVKEGISCYKSIRSELKESVPYWPIGLADSRDTQLSLCLIAKDRMFISVYRRGGDSARIKLPLKGALDIAGGKRAGEVNCIYPEKYQVNFDFDPITAELTVDLPKTVMARLFEVKFR